MIIRDEMPATQSMASGKVYDSKSAIRAEYKARGLMEIGNEKITPPSVERPRITKDEIGAAIQKVRDGYRPSLAVEKDAPAQTGWH